MLRSGAATVGVAVVVLTLLYLWPARLGGSASLVIVRGDSMLPAYRNGDLVIARAGGAYDAGDVVVYRVPDGVGEGDLIIHRLREVATDGSIVLRGDNRESDDAFGATTADIVGSARWRIPAGGLVLFVLSRWWILALVAGTVVTLLLWPASDRPGEDDAGPHAARA